MLCSFRGSNPKKKRFITATPTTGLDGGWEGISYRETLSPLPNHQHGDHAASFLSSRSFLILAVPSFFVVIRSDCRTTLLLLVRLGFRRPTFGKIQQALRRQGLA